MMPTVSSHRVVHFALTGQVHRATRTMLFLSGCWLCIVAANESLKKGEMSSCHDVMRWNRMEQVDVAPT